jgi:hypothetical protein
MSCRNESRDIVGMAVAVCVKNKTTTRGVYWKHLGELVCGLGFKNLGMKNF